MPYVRKPVLVRLAIVSRPDQCQHYNNTLQSIWQCEHQKNLTSGSVLVDLAKRELCPPSSNGKQDNYQLCSGQASPTLDRRPGRSLQAPHLCIHCQSSWRSLLCTSCSWCTKSLQCHFAFVVCESKSINRFDSHKLFSNQMRVIKKNKKLDAIVHEN